MGQRPHEDELNQGDNDEEDEEPAHYAATFTASTRSARKLTP
jgi:hypothetical protein